MLVYLQCGLGESLTKSLDKLDFFAALLHAHRFHFMIVDEAISCSGNAAPKALERACYKSCSIGPLLMRFIHGWTSGLDCPKPKQKRTWLLVRALSGAVCSTKGMRMDVVQT